MVQRLIQTQEQKQRLVQRLSQQQMLQTHLLEMPLAELEESIKAELDDNPALEVMLPDDGEEHITTSCENDDEPVAEASEEEHLGSDTADIETAGRGDDSGATFDEVLETMGSDDAMPSARYIYDAAEREERVYGAAVSFYDSMLEQVGETHFSDRERYIAEYIIGSLDADGLLRKDIESICDELAIYHNIDATTQEIESVIAVLQTFDPPGIAARSLQECLLLQINRRPESRVKQLMTEIVADSFDEFTKKHWNKIKTLVCLPADEAAAVISEIRRLNPKPGAALNETGGSAVQQITPDFIVETAADGRVTFTLNAGDMPEMRVAQTFVDMVEFYKSNKTSMNRREKEAFVYAKDKVERARGFIEAVRQRRHTLIITMKAIIDWQHRFFEEGDEADLRPMILKNIAEKTGLDISTISRVSNVKYAQTNWGTFPLRFFFSDGYVTPEGKEMSTRRIKMALKDIVSKEDKTNPMSDDALKDAMAQAGYPIARRTITKYREQLGIPVARLRK